MHERLYQAMVKVNTTRSVTCCDLNSDHGILIPPLNHGPTHSYKFFTYFHYYFFSSFVISNRLPNFHGMIASFEQYPRDWNVWFTSSEPENAPLPGEWENASNELQRMLILRSLRPDRVSFCATSFIVNNLGSK